jgi:hypothetical protein
MVHGRNLMATMFLATILLVGSRTSEAQDQSPSPRMLLNLDLFAAPKDGGGAQNTAGGDSMLHQLQTLRSMGYLTPEGPLPETDEEPPAPNEPAQTSQDEQRRQQ